MLKADLHSDGGISQGNQSGGAVKLSTKENQGGGATSAQRSHPVVLIFSFTFLYLQYIIQSENIGFLDVFCITFSVFIYIVFIW